MKRLWNYLMNWYVGWRFERAMAKNLLNMAPPQYILHIRSDGIDPDLVQRFKDEFNRSIALSKAWSEPVRLTDSEERRLIDEELNRQSWR